MIQEFKSYLSSQKVVAKKTLYFVRWVSQFYQYYKKELGTSVTQQEISDFLSQLSKNC